MKLSKKSRSDYRVAVVGGGIAGLVAAYRLHKRGFGVELFEASDRLGGTINTFDEDGWKIEFGPNTVPDRQGIITALVHDLGIQDQLQPPNQSANRRYIVRDQTLHALPTSLAEFRKTPLWSTSAKLRLFAEPLVPKRPADEIDESLYNLARRRLGEELVDYALDPFIAGTYGGSPKILSSAHALKRLGELEQESGSFIVGGLRGALGKRSTAKAEPATKPVALVNFKDGMQTLPRALERELEAVTSLQDPVQKLELDTGTWHVTSGAGVSEFDAVIVATQAYALSNIEVVVDGEPSDLSFFDDINYPPMSMVALGFRRSQIAHPLDGFGMLVPSKEPNRILGAIFSSTIFAGRAPRDHVMLLTFVGGGRFPELTRLPQDEQAAIAIEELDRLVGVSGAPVYVNSRQWERSIPQYEVGYERITAAASALEARAPGLLMTGNWRDGISVADVVRHAGETARSIGAFLHP